VALREEYFSGPTIRSWVYYRTQRLMTEPSLGGADHSSAVRNQPKSGEPPPRALPAIRAHFQMRRNPLQFMLDAVRRYGDIVRIDVGLQRAYLLARPDFIKFVLQDHRHNFSRGPTARWLKGVWGQGLLVSDGELWERQRKLVQPVFQHKRLAAISGMITDETQRIMDSWVQAADLGKPFNVATEMRQLTTRTLLRALFGTQSEEDRRVLSQCGAVLLGDVNDRMSSMAPSIYDRLVPRTILRLRALRSVDKLVHRIIADRRPAAEDQGDMLSMLLLARDKESGQGMGERQVRDEVMTLLLAGFESTSNALSWTWYLLSQNPQVECRLKTELDEVLAGRTPALEDLRRLTYTKMVLEESLRLYPPGYKFTRQALADDEIGGYAIPARSLVIISPWVTHRSNFWPDPEAFDPERFSPGRAETRPRFAYFPFGGGVRSCVGSEFAMMEAQLILATVAQRYRLNLADGYRVEPRAALTLQPRDGVMVVANRR
jgi:cytochrome P450